MLRNTKHILHACLLLALFVLITPSANAQLPSTINNNLQIIAYQVGSMAAEPALYDPLSANTIRIWGQNYVNLPTAVDVAAFFDANGDNIFTPAEMIYSSGSPLTLPGSSVNNGVGSIAGTTIVMPNLTPGNYDTRIVFYTPGSPLNPNGGLVRTKVRGTSSGDLTLMAVVNDDPNMIFPSIPDDCPIDQMIELETQGTINTTLNAVYSFRQLDLKVFYQNNSSNNNIPFTLVRHIVAIDPITGSPKVLPDQLILPKTDFFASNQGGQQIDFDEHLTFIYWPVGFRKFDIFYYLEDQNGSPIQIINTNSQINGATSYQSERLELCEGAHLENPNLDTDLFNELLNGNVVIEESSDEGEGESDGGRKAAWDHFQEELKEGLVFPNPSIGMTYLQLELAEPNQISWQILNTNGQQVSKRTIQNAKAGPYVIPLSTEDLAPGIYVCMYSINGKLYQKRFAKQ